MDLEEIADLLIFIFILIFIVSLIGLMGASIWRLTHPVPCVELKI